MKHVNLTRWREVEVLLTGSLNFYLQPIATRSRFPLKNVKSFNEIKRSQTVFSELLLCLQLFQIRVLLRFTISFRILLRTCCIHLGFTWIIHRDQISFVRVILNSFLTFDSIYAVSRHHFLYFTKVILIHLVLRFFYFSRLFWTTRFRSIYCKFEITVLSLEILMCK